MPERKSGENTAIQILRDLIRIPSYSGQEQDIQTHIEQVFHNFAIKSVRQGGNLFVHMKGKDQTRAFMLNSHVDVVDIGDETRWQHNPWGGDIIDGRIYGRGASDMKAGVTASIETAKLLAERVKHGEELPCDAWFVFVEREETDGAGTQSFSEWFIEQGYINQYKEVGIIFTEPTNMSTAQYGHRGNFFIRASVDGNAAHGSLGKQVKKNAILAIVKFIDDVKKADSEWEKQFPTGEFGPPSILTTAMEAKSASPNMLSDHAEAVFDLRTIPDFHDQAFARIQQIAQEDGISLSLINGPSPTGYTDPKAKILQLLQTIVPGLQLGISMASADLGFMTNTGAQGAIFGPGEKSQAHCVDESASVEHVQQAITVYQRLYDEWAKN